ncbi:hypothetical protein N9R54_05975 [Pelobium sp.]|nr:hypothetical protein [Pelobium sp.]MDA9555764.1 hypothetical protein [Pelobium sp.]
MTILACNSQTNNRLAQTLKIEISKDSSSIVLSGIDLFVLKELNADSLSWQSWQQNLAVYPLVEEDLQDIQKPLSGVYKTEKVKIIFTPNQKFKRGSSYSVEVYLKNPDTEITQQLRPQNSPFHQNYIKKIVRF